ncbi:MAG: metallophosphoesterase family protein [Mucilaginibacter sp.]|uniref:metallophosphoesterase family protein n=1 Tax=Mucilaginibacter sp. TaxID=1882438 RepID=UPI0031A21E18
MKTFFRYSAVLILLITFFAAKRQEKFIPVTDIRDQVLKRLIRQVPKDSLNNLDDNFILNFITKDEKEVFANNSWVFQVDQPAIVSVMHFKGQKIPPFWLKEAGFKNTGKTVSNGSFEYEVWQKEFPAGQINLGINGFDLERVVYFVTIGPIQKGAELNITNIYPNKWPVIKMQKGAYTYNDWPSLTLKEIPEELEGQTLYTTVRGRAREASMVKSFRPTEFPSSTTPDEVVLTWETDPATTQAVQWRTNIEVNESYVSYWKNGSSEKEAKTLTAKSIRLKDVYISNDMEVNHWEVNITGLTPATKYNYKVGSKKQGTVSPAYTFVTAPAKKDAPFKFLYIGDTHQKDIVKPTLERALKENPDAAFLTHTGDHVDIGLFRDLWDKQFHQGKELFARIPYMPVLGNHDSQDGLPPVLYTQLFMLPQNSTCGLIPERNYSFTYGDARFFVIDVTGGGAKTKCWLEEEMAKTKEKWKIAMMHFPPYHSDGYSPQLRAFWGPLFDKYNVDLVLAGHIHQYFRSYPIYGNQVSEAPGKGTVYVSSMVVKGNESEHKPSMVYNKVYSFKGGQFQVISINGNKLDFLSKASDGDVIDQFQIVKP